MRLVMFLAVLCYVPFVTNAHHSTAANFTQEIISVEGVIEQVRIQNPHSSVLIKNMDQTGNEVYWLVEASSSTSLRRKGASFESFEVGSKIKATGLKGRRQYTMYLREITFEDGTIFSPDRDPY